MSVVRAAIGICLLAGVGCAGAPSPLDLQSLDPAQDQWRIAEHYRMEAQMFRQKAEELEERARAYDRLFGPDSDWATGTRLLAQFYREEAADREHLALIHLDAGGGLTRGEEEGRAR